MRREVKSESLALRVRVAEFDTSLSAPGRRRLMRMTRRGCCYRGEGGIRGRVVRLANGTALFNTKHMVVDFIPSLNFMH